MALDVAIVDFRTPDALAQCADAAQRCARPVVVVSVPDDRSAVEALLAGAGGVVYTSAPPEQLGKAVRLVGERGVWAPRHVVAAALRQARSDADVSPVAESPLDRLSARERGVFQLAAAGLCNKEIAGRLAISPATIKVHLTHIFKKIGVRSRRQLAAAYDRIIRSS